MSNKSILDRRTRTRTEVAEQRKHLVDAAEAEQRTTLTAGESAAHRAFTEQLAGLDERIADLTAEVERAGTGLPRGGPASQDTTTRRWADNAVRAIRACHPRAGQWCPAPSMCRSWSYRPWWPTRDRCGCSTW